MRTAPTKSRSVTHIVAALLTSVALLTVPITAWSEDATPAVTTETPLASVTVATVAMADMVGQVTVSGTLVAQEEILVFPLVSGSTIETLTVDVGDTVVAGQIMATLDDSTLAAQATQARSELARAAAGVSQARSQIDSATANEAQANVTLERAQTLRRNGSGTQADLDQATAAQLTAKAAVASAQDGLTVAIAQRDETQSQLSIAELNLERATLRAPANGIISERNGQVGAISSAAGEPIFRLIRDSKIEIAAEVIETALGEINVGDTATFNVSGYGSVSGTVRRISPTVNATNRLGTIRVAIENNAALRTGVFASGQIITAERRSLSVPTTAILTDAKGTFVLVVKDGTLKKTSVVPGLIWNNLREIMSGLNEGDIVVARAGAFFADGDKINPIVPDAKAAEGASK